MDGEEIELGDEFSVSRKAPPLNGTQREILRAAAGGIRSVEAGVIVHTARGHCGFGAKGGPGRDGIGCCPYAAADGLEACKRLAKRGLLRRIAPGRWETT